MNFPFVPVDGFTPNNQGWSTVGNIDHWSVDSTGRRFLFTWGQRSLIIQILGRQSFRLRFNPAPGADYNWESSIAVVNRDLGLSGLSVNATQPETNQLLIDTGGLQIQVGLAPFTLAVYRRLQSMGAGNGNGSGNGNGQPGTRQLIHRDYPGQGVLYIPNAEVTAVMKTAPTGAGYVGLGEKAGARSLKNNFTFTFFNYDNFTYATGPALGQGGPLNPTEPLYCSIPMLMEVNQFPQGEFTGAPYAYGLFLDNTGQTFVNVSANDYSDMSGKYYLGALYNELDYYFMAGNDASEVLAQYTTLVGRSVMPPRYIFGFHQGAYGYYDRFKLATAANAYRAARIPCDGLHIDVDFQNNYRTFTHSEMKFPDAAHFFEDLHRIGFKMSTNITPILTDNELDETGAIAPYQQRANLIANNALIFDTRDGGPESPDLYDGGVNYGNNRGTNPYPYPPRTYNRNGEMPLQARGNYPDFGRSEVRDAWGEQYSHLINDLKLDMIWQDMTCPAIDPNLPPSIEQSKTFAQDLMMAREETNPDGSVQTTYQPNAKLHNSYVLNLLRATWEGLGRLRSDRRNFIIARGGYAGLQRFAGLWTGDSASSWDFLKINIPEVLNLGLSGVPISGCDIGGFAVGTGTTTQSEVVGGDVVGGITNYELFTRWMQLGSFLPWFRNHYDGYNKQFQEAYAYGEPVPTNCRRYVELRYRMLQIYYDAMYQWTQTGMPIARALFLNDPADAGVYQHLDDQFCIGRDFLVAPILDQHETSNPPSNPVRSLYLPAGSNWYAFMDNQQPLVGAVPGGTSINYYAGLDLVPIYVREGAILPFCELEQWVGQLPANPITFNCYPGPDRWTDGQAYQLYQDDGISTQAASGSFRLSRIYQRTLTQNNIVTRQVRVARVTDNFTPSAGFFYVALLASITKPQQIFRDGVLLPDLGDNPDSLTNSPVDAWYWNESIQIAFVKVFDNRPDTTVTVDY